MRRKNSGKSNNPGEIKNFRDCRRRKRSLGKRKSCSRRHFRRVWQSTTEKLGIKKNLRWIVRPVNRVGDVDVARRGLLRLFQVFQVRCVMCPR